jgi:hypothetical protein
MSDHTRTAQPAPPLRRLVRSASLALAGLATATTSLGVPAAATGETPAHTITLTDPTGDVWSISDGENAPSPAGDAPSADVVRAVVTHRPHRVSVRMKFSDLRRADTAFYNATIVTPRRLRAAFVMTGPRRWGGRHLLVDGNFAKVRCPGFRHSVDYAADQVTMTLPRACLGNPRWVRVELGNGIFRGNSEATFQEIIDNPHSTRADGGMTPRIYRAP